MPRMKSVSAKFDRHPRYKAPRRIFDLDFEPEKAKAKARSLAKAKGKSAAKAKVDVREVAEEFLKKVAGELGIEQDLSQLRYDKVNKSILGNHVLFQQYENGKPISGAWVRVDVDEDGKVYGAHNDLVPREFMKRAAKKKKGRTVAEKDAVAVASKAAKSKVKKGGVEVIETEECFYAGEDGPIPAWKVLLKGKERAGEWKAYVDADSGELLETVSLIKHTTGQGAVFDPNPVVTLNDTSLTDTSSIPNSAYFTVELPDLKGTGFLDGPYVTTKNTSGRVKRTSGKFVFSRGQKGFNEVMIYYHIDRVQRYLQSLGFDNILEKGIPVDAMGGPDDQSFYSPMTRSLTFGEGGVDDAEDADIILHEYGHAMQDNQVPGFGESHECGAMGEGFGDYLAGSFFADEKSQDLKPCVGSWDAVAYSGDEPPCLRRLDSNKKYPKDLVDQVHDDGEIWSACLWQVRQALGRKPADRLIVAHHFLITRTASFEDAALALIEADKRLNDGANEQALRSIFINRGILTNPKRKNRRAGNNPFGRKK